MAGTITQALTVLGHGDILNATKKELLISWVADASNGSVPQLAITNHDGWYLTGADTVPGVAVAPTANYDITLLNANSIDLADGSLTNRAASTNETAIFTARIPSGGFAFTLANNVVNSATGKCKLFLSK